MTLLNPERSSDLGVVLREIAENTHRQMHQYLGPRNTSMAVITVRSLDAFAFDPPEASIVLTVDDGKWWTPQFKNGVMRGWNEAESPIDP